MKFNVGFQLDEHFTSGRFQGQGHVVRQSAKCAEERVEQGTSVVNLQTVRSTRGRGREQKVDKV